MGKLGKAIAGLGAVAGGFVKGQIMLDQERRAEEDQRMQQEEHNARQLERQRAEGERIALANAARPVMVEEGAGGAIRPETMDNRDVGQPGEAPLSLSGSYRVAGKTFTDRGAADAEAKQQNTPEAQDQRISLALRQSGNPLGARKYEAQARDAQISAMDFAERKWRNQLGEALQRGHEGIADMVSNSQGDGLAPYKLRAVPSGDGKQVTYVKVNDDGSTTPTKLTFTNDQDGVIRAAYMLDRSVKPEQRYSHMVAEDKIKAASAMKEKELELKLRKLQEVDIPTAESRAAVAEIRAQIAQVRASGGGGADKVGREERLRYTTLFTEAGRRMQDSQRALSALQNDPMYSMAKPGSARAQELQSLRDSIASYKEEREMYGSLLAGSQGKDGKDGKTPSLADAEPRPKPTGSGGQAGPVKVATKAERDKLPKGAEYIGPDGKKYIKQ